VDQQTLALGIKQWITPWERNAVQNIWADHADGALVSEVPVGEGRLILCGCYLGDAYQEKNTPDFEHFLRACVFSSGWRPKIKVRLENGAPESCFYIKSGTSGGRRLIFVFFPPNTDSLTLQFGKGFLPEPAMMDLISDQKLPVKENGEGEELTLACPAWRFAVLVAGKA
jgi:hypothetical protein